MARLREFFWIPLGCLAVFGCSSVAGHLQRGDELSQSEDFAEALKEYKLAQEEDPENPEVNARITKTRQALISMATSEGQRALEAGDAVKALAAFKRAAQADPDSAESKQALKKVVDTMIASAQKAVEEGRFQEAFATLDAVIKELPQHPTAKSIRSELEAVWSSKLYAEASGFYQRGLYGNALIALIKLRKTAGAFQDSAGIEVASRDQIQEAARFAIAIQSAPAKKALQAPNQEVFQRLQSASIEQCPTAEIKSTDSPTLQVRVGLREIVFNQAIDKTSQEQKYQSGVSKVDNPKYQELDKKITENQDRIAELGKLLAQDAEVIEQAQAAFADAGPEDDEDTLKRRLNDVQKQEREHAKEQAEREGQVDVLREQLSATPEKLDEPIFDTYSYDVFKITRTVVAKVDLDAQGEWGTKLKQEEVQGTSATEDTSNPADPKHSVKEDPLQFPKTDEQLGGEAIAGVVTEIGKRLGELCRQWQEEILARARQASSGAKLEATEDYVLYLFVTSAAAPPAEVTDFLKQEVAFEDIQELRGKAGEEKP